MAEKMIKFRSHWWWEDSSVQTDLAGNPVKVQVLGNFGEVHDIPDDQIEYGETLGAFYTDEERDAIESGTYRGPAYDTLRSNVTALPPGAETVSALGTPNVGEITPEQVKGMDSADVAELITEGNDGRGLTVDQTVALAGTDPDAAEKVLDAEGMATDDEPRAGVTKALEKIISDATSGGA